MCKNLSPALSLSVCSGQAAGRVRSNERWEKEFGCFHFEFYYGVKVARWGSIDRRVYTPIFAHNFPDWRCIFSPCIVKGGD